MDEEQPLPVPEENSAMTRVLVVDDDDAIRTLVSRVFIRHGFYVETATDGAEAIVALDASSFDLMLLDLMMPHVDGIGVIEHLARSGRASPAVIVMTAAVPDILRRMDHQQIAAVIAKPFELPQLLRAAEEALQRRGRAASPAPTESAADPRAK